MILEQRIGERFSWLLTNQLYWPITPSVTPALRFGFAVDGWGSLFENFFPFLRSIPKKCYLCQILAVREGPITDAGDTVTNRDDRQTTAGLEDILPDAGDAIRNRDARQAGALSKGSMSYTGDTVRDSDAR